MMAEHTRGRDHKVWDCVVVGGGVMGSWTAYHLTKAGHRTLLLDQFGLPHARGSSFGQTRLIRMAFPEDIYMKMSRDAFAWWQTLAKETGQQLFKHTGIVIIAKEKSSLMHTVKKRILSHPDLCEHLTSEDLKKRYPMIHLPPGLHGVVDHTAGALLANKCLLALWEMIRRHGGSIQDATQVTSIDPASDPARIITNRGTILAKHVILTPGPWAMDLLKTVGLTLPLKTMNGYGVYMKDTTGEHSVDAGCPIFYHYIQHDDHGYRFCAMFPSTEYPGYVKMVTRGEPSAFYCHPDERDKTDQEELLKIMKNYTSQHLPGINPQPSIVEPCIYTMTPDKGFIVDHHPQYRNILFGAGGSGFGFIRAPIIGKLLCEMVQGKSPHYDGSTFKLTRFNTSKL